MQLVKHNKRLNITIMAVITNVRAWNNSRPQTIRRRLHHGGISIELWMFSPILLLIVAFFYDIFFVFVTPLIFSGKSVMITVATSGGPPTLDPAWCEKYPDDPGCQGGQPLPMLFQIPRLGDYQGGSSLLGLGDIVCKYYLFLC